MNYKEEYVFNQTGISVSLVIYPVSGNKGAVGVSFFFNGTSFGFVNCHLTSGSDKVLRYGVFVRYILQSPLLFRCCIENIFLSRTVCNVQEEPELCGHPQIAFSGWQTSQCLWYQPTLHSPLLVWRPQLQTWLRCTGQIDILYKYLKRVSTTEDGLDRTCE